ncbi:MAG: hypothetical protein JRM94_04760 [Nitrososphaerota archaeon]|nr:hypothetical protein [Nitrososphaerota archaeon]
MAKGDEPVYRGMVNDSNKKKVGDVSVWRNESRAGLQYLSGIISNVDGSKLRIVLFDAKKEESGKTAPSHL